LRHAAELYANGHNLKDPQLPPIYGDFTGLPPAILTSGTRDLFLSLSVLTHRKLRRAGVEAETPGVRRDVPRAIQFRSPAPETKEVFAEIASFFDKHLGR
jgi:monoterpene epsilon-lactone hydrolase